MKLASIFSSRSTRASLQIGKRFVRLRERDWRALCQPVLDILFLKIGDQLGVTLNGLAGLKQLCAK
jgi:hypothetical protein